ncbi:MAG: hypothetical protein GY754_24885 [bacterium]|nr:hypothetical protein [bacterium]
MKFDLKKPDNLKAVIPMWLLMNTVLGAIIAAFLSMAIDFPLPDLFFATQITTHITATLAAATGYTLGTLFQDKKYPVSILITVAGTLIVTAIACYISYLLITAFFDQVLVTFTKKNSIRMLIITLIISAIATFTNSFIERLRYMHSELKRTLINTQQKIDETGSGNGNKQKQGFSVKENDKQSFINYSSLVYISSHGRRSIIHTNDREHETGLLLREIEEKLPDETFIRIHKQYIANINFISRIEYYTGGRYLAYLNDDEQSTLPVGRTFISALKEKLGDISLS